MKLKILLILFLCFIISFSFVAAEVVDSTLTAVKVPGQAREIKIRWALPAEQHWNAWSDACISLCEITKGKCTCSEAWGGSGSTSDLVLKQAIPEENITAFLDTKTGYTLLYNSYVDSIANALKYVGNSIVSGQITTIEPIRITGDGKVISGSINCTGNDNVGILLDYENLKSEEVSLTGEIEFDGDNRKIDMPYNKLFWFRDKGELFNEDLSIINNAKNTFLTIDYKIEGVKTGHVIIFDSFDIINIVDIPELYQRIKQEAKKKVFIESPIFTITGEDFICYYNVFRQREVTGIDGPVTIGLYKIKYYTKKQYSRAIEGDVFHVRNIDDIGKGSILNPFDGDVNTYYDLVIGKPLAYAMKVEIDGEEKILTAELFDNENRISIAGLSYAPEDIIVNPIAEGFLEIKKGEAHKRDVGIYVNDLNRIS